MPAYPGSPGQNPDGCKMVVVVVVVTVLFKTSVSMLQLHSIELKLLKCELTAKSLLFFLNTTFFNNISVSLETYYCGKNSKITAQITNFVYISA